MSRDYLNNEDNEEFDFFCEEKEPVQEHKKPSRSTETTAAMVLALVPLDVDLSFRSVFPNPVLEIAEVKNQVVITKCRLLLPTDQLLFNGYIRRHISYHDGLNMYSLIEHVPFERFLQLTSYLTEPVQPKKNILHISDEFTSQPLPNSSINTEEWQSHHPTHIQQYSTLYSNEQPSCEIIQSSITETNVPTDKGLNRQSTIFSTEDLFTETETLMAIRLAVRVIQNQTYSIS
ncbi:hypothetical protein [Bacillus tuaregi]|uniref:hypothetical protein n=1 Tax=Bacillus tuaregi TaxID=1816695 RepID=UPI0008F898F9|nr:hypothetical protein [Bacillus tuaregi]